MGARFAAQETGFRRWIPGQNRAGKIGSFGDFSTKIENIGGSMC